jgi:hypothetical protein
MSYASLISPLFLLCLSASLLAFGENSGLAAEEHRSLRAAAAISMACLSLIGFFTLERSEPIWDSTVYVRMAARDGVLGGNTPPFCFRILTPTIARLLPLSLPASFELINQASLFGAAMLLYLFLRERRFTPELALTGPCFLILSSFTKFVIWYRFGVDQLAIFGIVAVSLALMRRRFLLAGLAACLFVLEKESVLLLAPFSCGVLQLSPRLRARRIYSFSATAALWAPAIALFAVLHTFVRHEGGSGIAGTIIYWAKTRGPSPKALCESLLALPKTFGAIPLVMFLTWRRAWLILKTELFVSATIVVFLLAGIFGASDYERVYFLALPFVLIVFLPLIQSSAPSSLQVAVVVLAQVSLLDIFARPDFLVLPRWFMTNTQRLDLMEYGLKVAFWCLALWFAGIGRDGLERSEA